MAQLILPQAMDAEAKIAQMREDARFDVTDAEANAGLQGIRQDIRARPALPKVPKVFLSNDCIFNCAYCGCRETHDCRRYASTPQELAALSYAQAKHGKHGIFLTSAIYKTPDYTVELIIQTMQILRRVYGYRGYIHAKIMPGTDPRLIYEAGLLANRLSVNIEVPRSEGYGLVAHNKNKRNILTPMGQIAELIAQARDDRKHRYAPRFATTQTTQMMAGSTGEDDFTILNLSGALYRKYNLSRVYYTSFQYLWQAKGYEHLPRVVTPPWRMHRLYQADRLMQLYGFSADELAPSAAKFLPQEMDPKLAWALRNLHLFPVEVNRADFETLLRVPGIGHTYAKRIVEGRRLGILTHEALAALGVSLKRSRHFITCGGQYRGATCDNETQLKALLADPSDAEQLAMEFAPQSAARDAC